MEEIQTELQGDTPTSIIKSERINEWLLPEIMEEVHPFLLTISNNSDGKWGMRDIITLIASGKWQLWLFRDEDKIYSAGVTEIIRYPSGKMSLLLVAWAGSEAKKWIHCFLDIEEWGKSRGCSQCEPVCPMGWEYWMRDIGYKRTHVVLRKEL